MKENMKEYEGICGKYEGNMTIPGLPAGGGNLTRTQFLRLPPVPKGKAGLPPKK